jgi:rubrerythrin
LQRDARRGPCRARFEEAAARLDGGGLTGQVDNRAATGHNGRAAGGVALSAQHRAADPNIPGGDSMSRLPRHLEHLKTGFTAEAVSAAKFRAFAEQAEGEGKANLARRWRQLAEAKDKLAIEQLHAAGLVRDEEQNLRHAIAEEQYENEVLYPRLIADTEHIGRRETAEVLSHAAEAQEEHMETLQQLRRDMTAATGDVPEGELATMKA